MKIFLFIFCVSLFLSSCKKDDNKYNKQTIGITNISNANWESIRFYSVVRNTISDSLIINNITESIDTVVVWNNITTANEDAWFEFNVLLRDKKILKGYGGQRTDLPYSKIPLHMSLAIYNDSVKVDSY